MDTILEIDVCLRLTVQFQCRPETHTLSGEMRSGEKYSSRVQTEHKWHDLTQRPNFASFALTPQIHFLIPGKVLRALRYPNSLFALV